MAVWPFRRKPRPLGERGERLARKLLKRSGCKILATNYRCSGGEIDLIVLEPNSRKEPGSGTICFVEVKTRSTDKYTTPESAVDYKKARRVRKAAGHYLATRDTSDYNTRYDIVSIVIRNGEKPEIKHLKRAF
ncbi:MAG: YraN family protein [Phycisphaerae bacterium]